MLRTRTALTCCTRGFLTCWLFTLVASLGVAQGEEPSQVCRITIPQLVEGRHDLELFLYHRDGAFHHGFARVAQRDNLPHRVSVEPSKPILFVDKSGQPIEVPEKARGYYSYKNPDFIRLRGLYQKGEIRIVHPGAPKPIAWDGRQLRGTVDVLILSVDEANTPGRNPHSIAWRIELDGKASGRNITGTFTAWTYAAMDDTYGADRPRVKGKFAAQWDGGFWRPKAGTEYARGKDWPQVRGPALNGSAVPTDAELVDNLHDARLLWVADERLGGGRSGQVQRGNFQMYPIAWTNINYGGYAAPAVADGCVFLYVMEADRELLARNPAVADNPYVGVGADPRVLANKLGCLRDAVLCFDARTGRKLWHFRSEQTFGNVPESKSGKGATACVTSGRVVARGAGGLYCLDQKTGKLLWHRRGEKGLNLSSSSGGGSRDVSPVVIRGTLIVDDDGALIGIDPQSGEILWTVEQAIGQNAVPTKVVLGGREYVVSASRLFKPSPKDREHGATDSPERLLLVEPQTGKIVWESDALGSSPSTLCVWEDIVCGNGVRNLVGEGASDGYRLAGVRVSSKGAKRLWQCNEVHYQQGRATQIAHQGHLYVDSRQTGFSCVEMATGKLVGSHPHIYHMTGGSHNWTWHVATNDRILTSGILMFTDAASGFKLMPGRLSLPLASGYVCPIKPAVADGRLFVRTGDSLVCYDLRKPKGAPPTQALTLSAEHAFLGVPAGSDDSVQLRMRQRGGEIFEVGARGPRLLGPYAQKAVSWIGHDSRAPWQATAGEGLQLAGEKLTGRTEVRIGHHYEVWAFDLARSGDRFEGTYRREVPPLDRPVSLADRVEGTLLREGGATIWNLYLTRSAGSTEILYAKDAEPKNFSIVLVIEGGKLTNAFAAGGGINQAAHEVDAGELTIDGNTVTGRATVIFHDDQYYDVDTQRAISEGRRAGSGRAIAAEYSIEAKAGADGRIAGKYEGTVGVAWSREGKISGMLGPDAAP